VLFRSDCSATTTHSIGHNLVQHPAGCMPAPKPSDVTGKAALLGQLKDNGGRTQTMAISATSPAVDAGACVLANDQRRLPRPGGGPKCDIGAFERQ